MKEHTTYDIATKIQMVEDYFSRKEKDANYSQAKYAKENGIPYQQFVNRSDMPGGATLGSIASSLVPMRTMDIGLPILAMHSARETMGSADQSALNRLIEAFLR